uniref:DUF4302 domain-containing protein n=1 Tax=Ornithobacterium rhinotracheale TaxID=28251 RepID=UPI0016231934|nr:DUF4302 domain-containing protein [Ornithobacterium rhinotracheale]
MSCNQEEEHFFEQRPNERILLAKDSLFHTLTSATNGWEMIYFPKLENKFDDLTKNIIRSKNYGVIFVERDYGKGGFHLLMKFKENGEVEMLSDKTFTSKEEVKTSQYSISHNSYTQLNFISPNYIFETRQTSFLFFKKDADGSLIFSTNKYPNNTSEYIVLKPIPAGKDWEEVMKEVYDTKLQFERKRIKNLSINNPYGEEVFVTNFSKDKHTDVNKRYTVFLRNMQPHVTVSKYYTGLGSGYVAMEDGILMLPGIQVNDSVNFTQFKKKGNSYVASQKGFQAIIY